MSIASALARGNARGGELMERGYHAVMGGGRKGRRTLETPPAAA
jgi:hypothetical protein